MAAYAQPRNLQGLPDGVDQCALAAAWQAREDDQLPTRTACDWIIGEVHGQPGSQIAGYGTGNPGVGDPMRRLRLHHAGHYVGGAVVVSDACLGRVLVDVDDDYWHVRR